MIRLGSDKNYPITLGGPKRTIDMKTSKRAERRNTKQCMFILGGCDDGTVGPVGGWSGAILRPPTAPVTPSLCNTNLRRHVIRNRIKSPEIGVNSH